MATQYAKDQPSGFTNRIERVAIVGAGGSVGTYLTEELLKTGRHHVTALSRVGSKSTIPAGATVVSVDYDDEASLVEALQGQQFLVVTMHTRAPPEAQEKIVRAAAAAGVRWVMPNCYGSDFTNRALGEESLTGPGVWAGIRAVEEAGGGAVSWVAMGCSHWYEFSLAAGAPWFGFDFARKTVTFYDAGTTRIAASTWRQCGRALAALLSLPELPADSHDAAPSISRWRNGGLWISSFFVSQRDMLDSVHRVTGSTDADWTIEHEASDARWRRGMEMLQGGDMRGLATAMYARIFYPNGDGDLAARKGLANEVLGLPAEDLDEATKRALDMVASGYDYNARP